MDSRHIRHGRKLCQYGQIRVQPRVCGSGDRRGRPGRYPAALRLRRGGRHDGDPVRPDLRRLPGGADDHGRPAVFHGGDGADRGIFGQGRGLRRLAVPHRAGKRRIFRKRAADAFKALRHCLGDGGKTYRASRRYRQRQGDNGRPGERGAHAHGGI